MDSRLQKALMAGSVRALEELLDSDPATEVRIDVDDNQTSGGGGGSTAVAAADSHHAGQPTSGGGADIENSRLRRRQHGVVVVVRFVPRLLESRILRGLTSTGDGVLHVAALHGREDLVRTVFRKSGVRLGEDEDEDEAAAAGQHGRGSRGGGDEEAEAELEATTGEDHQQQQHPRVVPTATVEPDETMRFSEFLRARNKMGETCLHEAVRSAGNSRSLVDLLMAVDAKAAADDDATGPAVVPLVQILDHDGTSPLYLATTLRRVDIIQAFTAAKTYKYSVSSAGPQGRTALHAAVVLSTDLCDLLLKWNKSLASKRDNLGRTPIHYLGTSKTDTAITELLLKEDSSTGYCADSEGWLPVHVAASRGRLDIVTMLVEKCPECIFSCNKSGQTFLHVAVDNGHSNIVGYVCRESRFSNLLNMRDLNGDTALHMAVQKGDEFIFWRLLRNKDVCLSFLNRQGQTPLDLAILAIEAPTEFKYKWEWIRDDLVYMRADLSSCRWDDLKVTKIQWDSQISNPMNLIGKIGRDGPIKLIRQVLWDSQLINLITKIRRDGLIKLIREVLLDYPIKRVHEKTDDLIFSSSTIPERDDDKESERLGKAAAVLAAGALLILTLSFQAPLDAADKKPLSAESGHARTQTTFIRLVPVDTVSMAASVLSIFFCTIAGFPTRRFWIRSKALLLGGILLGAAAVAILLVFSLGISLVYDYPRWWIVVLVYGVITVVTLLSFSFFTKNATRTGSPRQVLAWVLVRCQRCGLLNYGLFLLQQFSLEFLPLYAFLVPVAIWFLFQFLVN